MKAQITSITNLWLLFALTLALMAGFVLWTPSVGGVGLDSLAAVDDVQTLLASMSSAQKNSHFWMTLLLDMLFPLAYAAYFNSLSWLPIH